MGNISDTNKAVNRPNYLPSNTIPDPKASNIDSQRTNAANNIAANERQNAAKRPETRPLSTEDLGLILTNLGKENSPENKQLLMLMIEHGVETSQQAFEHLEQLLKGRKSGNTKESAVIAHSKNLKYPKATEAISNYLSNKLNYAKIAQETHDKMRQFQSVLNDFSKNLDSALLTGLGGIISEFISEHKKQEKNKKEFNLKALLTHQSDSVKDINYLLSFLKGLEQKLEQSTNIMQKGLSALVKDLSAEVSLLQDSLISQLILSKNPNNIQVAEDFFHYFMIPNPLLQNQKDMQLLISKDSRNKKRINPEKTKIVLKFETNDLGDLTVVIEIDEKKLHYRFYSNEELTQKFIVDYTPDLRKSMEALNYDIIGITNNKKTSNTIPILEKLLFPKFDLNDITRISTEA